MTNKNGVYVLDNNRLAILRYGFWKTFFKGCSINYVGLILDFM